MDRWGYPSPGRRISQVGYWHDGVCVCVGVGRGGGGGGKSILVPFGYYTV